MVPHPDTDVSNPGSTSLVRLFSRDDGSVMTILNDGSITVVDFAKQSHAVKANILSAAAKGLSLTWAHTMNDDHSLLHSFVQDSNSNNYVITTDLTTFTVGEPVLMQPIEHQLGQETPINAFMMPDINGNSTLFTIAAGNFDSLSFVDFKTGARNPMFNNMADGPTVPGHFLCNEATKDCDYWVTSTVSPKDAKVFFQAHSIAQDDVASTADIFEAYWYQQKTGTNAIMDVATNAPVFGWSSYLFVEYA